MSERRSLVLHQESEQAELGGREVDNLACLAQLAAINVQMEVADRKRAPFERVVRAHSMQDDMTSRNQVGAAERFGDVVVGTGLEGPDNLFLNVRGGHQQDPDRFSGCPDLT